MKTCKRFLLKMMWKKTVLPGQCVFRRMDTNIIAGCGNFCREVNCMGCRYNVYQKDGVITQLYQIFVCRTSMHDIKKD